MSVCHINANNKCLKATQKPPLFLLESIEHERHERAAPISKVAFHLFYRIIIVHTSCTRLQFPPRFSHPLFRFKYVSNKYSIYLYNIYSVSLGKLVYAIIHFVLSHFNLVFVQEWVSVCVLYAFYHIIFNGLVANFRRFFLLYLLFPLNVAAIERLKRVCSAFHHFCKRSHEMKL